MKASETVLKESVIQKLIDLDTERAYKSEMASTITFDVLPLLKTQAEISFKAGIQEVVEWVETQGLTPGSDHKLIRGQLWQQQKKDWGIK